MLGPLSYCTHTKPLSLFTCPVCNSVFLFSQKTGFLQLRFRLLLYFPCARHRHAFKGYDLFCTAPDSAALKVRELLFLLRIYALLKRKKKKSPCHPSAQIRKKCLQNRPISFENKERPSMLLGQSIYVSTTASFLSRLQRPYSIAKPQLRNEC